MLEEIRKMLVDELYKASYETDRCFPLKDLSERDKESYYLSLGAERTYRELILSIDKKIKNENGN